MAYYIMTTTEAQTFANTNSYQNLHEANLIAKQKCIDDLGFNPFERGSLSSHSRMVIRDNYAVALQPVTDLLATFQTAMSKKKADLVAEASRYFDMIGVTEGYVKNVSLRDLHYYWAEQSWYVFKENGKWFFKMREDCKASHEVA